MAKSDLTAINAKTISVNTVPIAGSAAAYGPYTTFDQIDADVVLALNGTVIQGTMTSGLAYTTIDHLNVLSGISLNEAVVYGTASTPASNNATGPINAGGGGTPTPSPTPTPTPSVVRTMLMGQSENEYVISPSGAYRTITQPTPGNNNLILFYQGNPGVAPTRTAVNPTTVAAGQVNPAMAAASAFLAYTRPGVTFVLGDLTVAGTSRYDLADDTTNASDGRLWTDYTAVVNMQEAEFGQTQNVIEAWYNADAAFISTFKPAFWSFYFGSNADGSNFNLGGTVNSREIDHCVWDGQAASTTKGRGQFTRAGTKLSVITPMPFLDAPDSAQGGTEMQNFSSNNARLSEPARATVIGLASDPLAQSVGLTVGPSAHIAKFGGASTPTHPDTANRDGQILYMWPIALNMLRASGMTIGEPLLMPGEATIAADGSYMDIPVSLPNGGILKTLASHRGTTYAGTSPHQQPVTGIELTRAGEKRPVFRTDQTTYPASHRGTVTIQNTGTGTGSARRGIVRVTPTVPFTVYGDTWRYLGGQATAMLVQPRDLNLYPWFLIEHIPALFDASALYPFEGIAVRPEQADMLVPIPAPSFTGRASNFDGGDYFTGANFTGTNAPVAGSSGTFSMWVRNASSPWNTPSSATLFGFRTGSPTQMSMKTTGSGRMNIQLNNDTATDTLNFYANTGTTAFNPNQYYWIAGSWSPSTGLVIFVNGVQVGTLPYATLDMAGLNVTHFGLGASTAGTNPWIGDIGHFYLNLTEFIDFTVAGNRAKFANGGQPVDLGTQGALPTGRRPEYYGDGNGAAWNNQGTATFGTLTGALTASSPAPSY